MKTMRKNHFILASMVMGLWVFGSAIALETYTSTTKMIILLVAGVTILGGWTYFFFQFMGGQK